MSFVPEGFTPPREFVSDGWRLVPLGIHHTVRDHRAWMGSLEHIQRTPGFIGAEWPRPMELDENTEDLRKHAAGFRAGTEFTYSVLDPGDHVIGCVYVTPDPLDDRPDAAYVRSWVTSERAELDVPLRTTVANWLRNDWPFADVRHDEH